MSSPNSRYLLRLAEPQDTAAIGRVQESGSFPGQISVQFTRRPDAYQSYLNDGDTLVMLVAEDRKSGQIVAVGGCVLRQVWLNGELRTVGYLTGLKIAEEHRKGLIPLREAYALLYKETRNHCSAYYTTILSANTDAVTLLEKNHKGMPTYHFQGEYTVYCFGTGGHVKLPAGLQLIQGKTGISEFYHQHLPNFQFAPANENLYGLQDNDYYSLQTSAGEILAACAIWNQQSYKQYRVTGYNCSLRLLQKLPTQLMGLPKLPQENNLINYACIALPFIRSDALPYAKQFLRAVTAKAKAHELVLLGLMGDHPLNIYAKKLPHIKYQSRLYTVHYDDITNLAALPVHLEVGLL